MVSAALYATNIGQDAISLEIRHILYTDMDFGGNGIVEVRPKKF